MPSRRNRVVHRTTHRSKPGEICRVFDPSENVSDNDVVGKTWDGALRLGLDCDGRSLIAVLSARGCFDTRRRGGRHRVGCHAARRVVVSFLGRYERPAKMKKKSSDRCCYLHVVTYRTFSALRMSLLARLVRRMRPRRFWPAYPPPPPVRPPTRPPSASLFFSVLLSKCSRAFFYHQQRSVASYGSAWKPCFLPFIRDFSAFVFRSVSFLLNVAFAAASRRSFCTSFGTARTLPTASPSS